ncbi:probable dual-specificity RNA methyltransferase RlmN isoform X2 [Mangifera indica]|uniref:probable dual-specificity RNA methyltransferase RlmN isoform X2 n=1 Tax=Mangifera indica TaxID=29780 RepID=UPI001CF97A8A|nr:probable dual-specificity RNA methyltransferase RlmN isoform X2 [Mangifera indica]XP_044476958.1 probable dual-specificity RNA methyltransferase RlmN isoform X2 [Mangifera indica]
MPAAQAFPLEKLTRALHVYQKNSQQKIFIECVVLDKVNDKEPHAHQLGKLLETSQLVTIDVASPEAGVIKEGMLKCLFLLLFWLFAQWLLFPRSLL